MVKAKIEKLKNEPCTKCHALGDTLQKKSNKLILLTLSPNPEWKDYNNMNPDVQYDLLKRIIREPWERINNYFNKTYKIVSQHFEFNKSGNLHSHNIVSIDGDYGDYERNLIYISKQYHKIIGMQFNRASISADTRWITDIDIYKYLNKENAYAPEHIVLYAPNIVEFFPKALARIDEQELNDS